MALVLDYTVCGDERRNLSSCVCSIDLPSPRSLIIFNYLNLNISLSLETIVDKAQMLVVIDVVRARINLGLGIESGSSFFC